MEEKPKLTEWIDGRITPTSPGVYQRRYYFGGDADYYARWDGHRWYAFGTTPEQAMAATATSAWPNRPWRGLAEKPA